MLKFLFFNLLALLKLYVAISFSEFLKELEKARKK